MTLLELTDHLKQADTLVSKGTFDEAERIAQEVMEAIPSLKRDDSDSIGSVQDKLLAGELRCKALQTLCNINMRRGNYQLALVQAEESLSVAEQQNLTEFKAKALGTIGNVHWNQSDYAKALEFFSMALSADEEMGNKAGVARHQGNIGSVYRNLSDYTKALECHIKALHIDEELGNKAGVAVRLGNIGSVYRNLSDFSRALEYHNKALYIDEELGNKADVARHLGNIGMVYRSLSDFAQALEYFAKALRIAEELGIKASVAKQLSNIGIVHHELADYTKALEYYAKALTIDEELGNKTGVSRHLGNMGNTHWYLCNYAKALEYLVMALRLAEELGNKAGVAGHLCNIGAAHEKLMDYDSALEYYCRGLDLQEQLGRRSDASEVRGSIGGLYANKSWSGRDESKAEAYLLESIALSEELGTKKYDAHKTLAELYESQERWKESHYHLNKYLRLKEETQSDESKKSAVLIEQRRQIAEREREIAIAKAAADAKMSATTSLLHKVLPESVATRMINGESEIADYYANVSILFADIAGFTPISAHMPAIDVVRFLNHVFAEFDRIIKKHGCEKIKTIGDGYMAVCGAPIECADHAERLAAAALEMQETISLPDSIREFMPGGIKLGIRFGLHTGSVVAGVIGEERFVYDIYSDAVNTAARMESHGEAGRIHVSEAFYRAVTTPPQPSPEGEGATADHITFAQSHRKALPSGEGLGGVLSQSNIHFTPRGETEIKGKGIMRTYFLEKA